MGNSISTEEDDEKRSQSTAADTEAEENAAKLVRDIEDTYQTASDFYGNLLCCLCMFNNLCCLTWMLSIGVLCFLVFLTFGIVFLITDAGIHERASTTTIPFLSHIRPSLFPAQTKCHR